jgi:hypothetical protein
MPDDTVVHACAVYTIANSRIAVPTAAPLLTTVAAPAPSQQQQVAAVAATESPDQAISTGISTADTTASALEIGYLDDL